MTTLLNKNNGKRLRAYATLNRQVANLADTLASHDLSNSRLVNKIASVCNVLWRVPTYTARYGQWEDWSDELDVAWHNFEKCFCCVKGWEELNKEIEKISASLEALLLLVFNK